MAKKIALLFSIALLLCASFAQAMQIKLQWDSHPAAWLAGYHVYYRHTLAQEPFAGVGALQGASPIDAGMATSATVDLPATIARDRVWYFEIAAYSAEGFEVFLPGRVVFGKESAYKNGHWYPILLSSGGKYPAIVRYCTSSDGNACTPTASPAETGLSLTTLVVDNTDSSVDFSGGWASSTYFPGQYGADYMYTNGTTDTFNWPLSGLATGTYNVSAWWTSAPTRPASVTYRVTYNGGAIANVIVDQTAGGNQWNLLGSYLNPTSVKIVGSSASADGVCADAVMAAP